ncbi:MAG: PTS transporter subunit EIIC [Selenomonadaceae bacterium]|nr:PTS transporter subunit EIIC [Selenomonadaceae bacterium]
MNKNKLTTILKELGQSFMPPIAVMAVAGLLLGIGAALTNSVTLEAYGLSDVLRTDGALYTFFILLKSVGKVVFNNLSLMFAISVAYGMAKEEKGAAALAALVAFFSMNMSINVMLRQVGFISLQGVVSDDVLQGTIANVCGITTLQTGVFGGVIVGLGIAFLHNRFYQTKLPTVISFFNGSRFVSVLGMVVFMLVGVFMTYFWHYAQYGIFSLGNVVTNTGYFGTFLFGAIKRALIPLGLHHVFYMPFWQTAVGGSAVVDGVVYHGGQNIFLAELASSTVAHVSSAATAYFSGEFIFIMFGLPGAALAMYHAAKPEKRKAVAGLFLSAAGVSFLTGTTQPIEFSFLFVAPVLYAVHVVLCGAAYTIAQMADIGVGLTYSGGLLDFLVFGVLPGNDKTGWIKVLPLGVIYFFVYYGIFRFLIRKNDYKTPGREDDEKETP